MSSRSNDNLAASQQQDTMNRSKIFAADWTNHCLRVNVPSSSWPELELKMKICCKKCVEILEENIRELKGVVQVKTDRKIQFSTVIVTGCPDSSTVLKKAKEFDKKATISILKVEKAKEIPKVKENKPSTSSPPYRHSQNYPPRYHPTYPETDYPPLMLYVNPNYFKHVVYDR